MTSNADDLIEQSLIWIFEMSFLPAAVCLLVHTLRFYVFLYGTLGVSKVKEKSGKIILLIENLEQKIMSILESVCVKLFS